MEAKTTFEKYISITDMCYGGSQHDCRRPANKIKDWMSKKTTIEFLGLWETRYNPAFNVTAFNAIKDNPKYYCISTKQWIEQTSAIGIAKNKNGKPGTFVALDIAYDFGIAVIPEFRFAFFTGDFELINKYLYPLQRVKVRTVVDKMKVLAKFDKHCAYCGSNLTKETFNIDHIMPKVKFGAHLNDEDKKPYFLKHLTIVDVNHPDNLFPACLDCNRAKRYKDLETFRWTYIGPENKFYFEKIKVA